MRATAQAKLTWGKVGGTTGYEIYRSTKAKSGFKKIRTITPGSRIKCIDKGIVGRKKYYYKVRAYRAVRGKKVYGPFSNIKQMKTAS